MKSITNRAKLLASYWLLVLLSIWLSFSNCSRTKPIDTKKSNKQHQLDSLLDISADEISRFPKEILKDLKKADSIAIDLQDSIAMCLINLGKSRCHQRLEQYDSSLIYVFNALKLTKAINNDTLLAKANNDAGNIYSSLNDYATASTYFSNALDLVESIQNSTAKAVLLNNLGIVYTRIGENEWARKYYREAASIYDSVGDDYRKAFLYLNLIPIYIQLNDSTSIRDCYSEAYSIFKKIHDTVNISKLMINMSTYYKQIDNIDSAIQLLTLVIENAKSLNHKGLHSVALHNMGSLYFYNLNNPEKGRQLINSSLKINRETSDLYRQTENINLLADIEIKNGNYKLGYEYYREYIRLKDSIIGGDVKKAIITNDLQNKIEKREYKSKLLQQKLDLRNKQNLILYISIFSILLFVVMLGLFIRASYRSLKKTNTISELENQRLEEQLELDRKVSEIEKLRLDSELDAKKKEMISHSLKLISKNDLLNNISKLADKYFNDNDLNSLFYNDLTKIIDENLNVDKEWGQFKELFEQVHHDFFNHLKQKQPTLTEHELRFCAYVKIGLNTKEIARLLNILPETVRKFKSRLKKKFSLDKDTYMEDFLRSV